MVKRTDPNPKSIDSLPKLGALTVEKLVGVLGSWKKTFRLALLLGVGIGAAVVAKYLIAYLQGGVQ